MSTNPVKFFSLSGGQPTAFTTNPVPQFQPNQPPAYTTHHLVPQVANNIAQMMDDEAELSPIAISIAAPVTVTGDGNRVSLDPAEVSTRVAHAIAAALRQTSMSCAGVPMIDENGRPRPIEVRVDAAVKVEGNQNIVGERAFQAPRDDAMPNHQQEENESDQNASGMDEPEEMERGRKRQRAA